MFADVVVAVQKANKNWQDCYAPDKKKVPLYGPLNIEGVESFLEQSKKDFHTAYENPFPYNLSVSNFQLLYLVGQGGFGKVLLVKYKQFSSYYAMKCQLKSYIVKNEFVSKIHQEKRILQSLNFPFCIYLLYFCQDNSYLYFLLPFISGGELFSHLAQIRRFGQNLAKFYAAQVVLSLEYLHTCDLVYRDLKPENILLDHLGYIKMTDFGLAKIIETRTYTFCGTPDYIAPEVIKGQGYGKAVDWWSFGAFVFELCAGHTPFAAPSVGDVYEKILNGDYQIPLSFGEDLTDLIQGLLQPDVTKRMGNLKSGVADIKNHGWFQEIDWLYLLNRRIVPPYVPPMALDLSKKYFPHLKDATPLSVDKEPLFDAYFKDF